MSKGKILVIDDQKDLVDLVRHVLEREGFQILAASQGETGLAMAINETPDVVLLDRAMPGLDGLEVCRRLRKEERTAHMPILLLTARVGAADRVAGLEAGADDYMTKPFSPRELVARIKAALRRASLKPPQFETIRVGDLVMDVARHQVSFRDRIVALTAGEFRILRFLADRPGRVVTRTELIDGALGSGVDALSRTIDVHLAAIRRKLGRGAGMIETVRGVGYRLAEPVSAVATPRGR